MAELEVAGLSGPNPNPGRNPDPAAKRSWHVGAGTGVGSLPGTSPDEAARVIAGELPELPYLAELPARGVGADMVGRALGILVDLFGEVVPSGWRVTRRPGRDIRRANDLLEWDLDALTEHYAGADWVKLQVCGPWTLAAEVELSSGNRALTDDGAVNDIAASLTQGLLDHVSILRRRLPGTDFVVQLDEPQLPAVIDGLGDLPAVVHCCHPGAPLHLLRASGFQALSIDFTGVGTSAARLDPIGELIEGGTVLMAGLVPGERPAGPDRELKVWAAPVLGVFDRLGFPRAALSERVVPTPTCGLAGADDDWALEAVKTVHELARALQDLPEGW